MLKEKRSNYNRGQGVLELALILPVLVLLVLGAVDMGRAFFSAIVIQNSTRAGARHGADLIFPLTTANVASKEAEIKAVTYEEAINSGVTLQLSNITVSCIDTAGTVYALNSGCSSNPTCNCSRLPNQRIRVSATLPFQFITTFFTNATINITRFTEMKVQ